jgi:hypothetical protein
MTILARIPIGEQVHCKYGEGIVLSYDSTCYDLHLIMITHGPYDAMKLWLGRHEIERNVGNKKNI